MLFSVLTWELSEITWLLKLNDSLTLKCLGLLKYNKKYNFAEELIVKD